MWLFLNIAYVLAPSATIEHHPAKKPEAADRLPFPTSEATDIEPAPPIEIYTAYVDSDKDFFEKRIKKMYGVLRRQNYRVSCHESEVTENSAWQKKNHLNTAGIIILLISLDFLDTDFCYHELMKKAVERHNQQQCYIIPILVRPTPSKLLQNTPFGNLDFLPGHGKTVSTSKQHDKIFVRITNDILDKLRNLQFY